MSSSSVLPESSAASSLAASVVASRIFARVLRVHDPLVVNRERGGEPAPEEAVEQSLTTCEIPRKPDVVPEQEANREIPPEEQIPDVPDQLVTFKQFC